MSMIHYLEVTSDSYLVSAELMRELQKFARKTDSKDSIDSMFGVEIRESFHLPFEIEDKESE